VEYSSQIPYYVGFSKLAHCTPVRFRKMRTFFSSMELAWRASVSELREAGIEQETAETLVAEKEKVDIDVEMATILRENILLVIEEDNEYPHALKHIYNPPWILYYRGTLPKKDECCLGIVGTRKMTSYGKIVTPRIVSELAVGGVTTVSGLAFGIDALVHTHTIEANGRTIAVLASGVDRRSMYPSAHHALAERIVEQGGMLCSEYPPGTIPQTYFFPLRNRIISGLSRGILVIEAGETSGALITARYALDQNRDVFAVPGPVTSFMSVGPNELLKKGAYPVTCAKDILDAFSLSNIHEKTILKKREPLSGIEGQIMAVLSGNPIHIDEISRLCNLDTSSLSGTLLIMEMKKIVRNVGAQQYIQG